MFCLKHIFYLPLFILNRQDYNVWNVNLIKKPYKEDLQNANKQSESHRKSHSFNQSLADWKIILEKDVPLEVCDEI